MSETLRFDLLANDRASAVFDKVGKSASDTETRFSKVGKGLATVSRLAGTGAVLFGGLAGAGAMLGLKTAAGMEQARISFTTMLGSAKKADGFLKELAAFAAKTPFEFPELQTAASSLISAGFEAGKVIPIMTTLGDVTSGMGTGAEGVQRATVALQQMSAAGRITGEDLNQLRDAGVPVFDLLASATGKSKEAISALAQQGKLGKTEMQALFDALGTGKGLERFSGLMEKQSSSLTGMVSTFKDTLGQGLAKAIEPAIPLIKDGLGRLTGAVGTALDALPGIVANVKDFAGPIVQKIRDAIPLIQTAVGEWAAKITGFADGITFQVAPVIASIRTALDSGDWGSVGTSLGNALLKAIQGAGDVVGKIGTALGGLLGKIDFVGLGIAMGKQAPSVLIGFAAGLLNVDLGGLLSGMFRHWQDILVAGVTIFLTPAKIIGKVGQMLARIPLVGRLLEWGLLAIKGFVDRVGNAIGNAFGFLGNAFLGGIRRVFPGIGSAFGNALAVLPTRVGIAAIQVAERASGLMASLRGAIVNKIGNVVGSIGELVAKIVRGFAGMAGSGLSAGMDLVRGFINGIKALAGQALQAARDMATAAFNAVKDKLKIFSPSKATYELGAFFAQGFEGGIKDKTKAVASAVSELAKKAVEKLQGLKDKARSITDGIASAMTGALDVGGLGSALPTNAIPSASELERADIAVTRARERVNNPGEGASATDLREAALALQDALAAQAELQARAAAGPGGGNNSVTDQLANFAAQSGQFAAALAAAAGKGLNSGLIQKIAQLGPTQGLTAAQALAAMDQAQVASANASLAAVDKYANELGRTVLTTTSLPADIARQQGVLDTLLAIKEDLAAGRTIQFVVNDATDPDRVVAAIRKYIRRNGKLRGVAEDD